ncbi:MAG: MATE family efflux transporter, partial [Saprospiraceae bacterium]|nr:MATE family efflux transporter [Saprospiraceae bacterium]
MWQEVKYTLRLGWPIILGNLTQIALGVIDSAMVGAIHSSQLAAAAFVNSIIAVPMILGMGLTMAISPLVATAQGRDDYDAPLRILYNGLWVSGIITVFIAVIFTVHIDMVYY